MCVFEYLFEIQPEGRAWRLSSASLDSDLYFDTYAQAEQRAAGSPSARKSGALPLKSASSTLAAS